MTNETRDVWVVFNGEIYNHAELRTVLRGRGHQFRTHHSDTEVLVHGFEEWGGRGLLDRVRGMFAFAILDLRNRQLLLARDPFGEKPMYVANDGRGIAFASELKAVLRSEFVGQQLSEPGLGDYLRFGYVPAPGCILERVWKLRAAEMATIDLDRPAKCHKESYWQLTDHTPVDVAPERWLVEFDERLSHSVQQKLMSDVPTRRFLSGRVGLGDCHPAHGSYTRHSLAPSPSGFRDTLATRRVTRRKSLIVTRRSIRSAS